MADIDPVIEHRSQYAVEVLSRYTPVAAAYLFGSWVEGSADEESDIDLAVFLEDIESWDLATRAHTAAWYKRRQAMISNCISSPLVRCTNPTSPVSPRISWRMVSLSNRKVQSVSSHAGDRV